MIGKRRELQMGRRDGRGEMGEIGMMRRVERMEWMERGDAC